MSDPTVLAARYAGRPLLLTSVAAHGLALRLRELDPQLFSRPNRLQAFLRRVGLAEANGVRGPALTMEDDGPSAPPVPLPERLAYAPTYAGEPEDVGYCWTLSSGVALMCADTPLTERGEEFCGTVYHGYDTLLAGMQEAAADPRVGAIFLRLDSPGGVAGGALLTLTQWMRENRAAAGGKPIWVYADMACSAAYWVGSQGDRMVAAPFAQVGSIGCVIVHEDLSGALGKAGVVVTPVEYPVGKTDGASFKPLPEGTRAAWLADATEVVRRFTGDVEAARPQLTAAVQLALNAGAFFGEHADPARSALALGLVDAVGDEAATFAELAALVAEPAPVSAAARGAPAAAAATPEKTVKSLFQPRVARPGARSALAVASPKPTADTAAGKLERIRQILDDANLDDDTKLDQIGEVHGEPTDPPEEPTEPVVDPAAPLAPAAPGANHAAAISATPEAKANPQLALTAIAQGLNVTQFKAMAADAAAAPKVSRLDRAMASAPSVGQDAASRSDGFGSTLTARAAARRAG